MTKQLVSVDWLRNNLYNDHLIVLDASADYDETQTIHGARHFDIKNTFSDLNNPLPNSFPSPEIFEKGCQNLGINTSSHIVVYDNKGIFTSPRVWWMFKTFGHDAVSVLDGGLPSWRASGYSVIQGTNESVERGNFKAQLDPRRIATFENIQANIRSQDSILIDARSSGRFRGTAPEPRPQLKSGQIKNSINLPYTEVLEDGKYKSNAQLQDIFSELPIAGKSPIFSCGSGITACIILLAYDLISEGSKTVYDGSWTEWATRNHLVQ
ncbi:sulfurtransferase [Dokdonia sinensis]|uniref:Sulfurtransferase n=1 Tax=Dokdonia sinensis TaxID=2479847 RepID=A0A3M0GMU3_9FLAO|nr:sulfurtransferase [Dokdonia sinensis]RMB62953.1 sulfurtransferase [Dokdonia sinensis]